MCGFVGFIDKSSNKKNIIEKMSEKIIHRGPDSFGFFTDENIALGFRRLSIIDLNNSHQPIYNEDDSLVITFNGEIYNFLEIKRELQEKGHVFKTNGDTEVIIHGYEEYGKYIVNKLRGMFSFVIWDKKKNILFGARDYFGIKPFYYSFMKDSFIFGSEIKSFLPHPNFEKQINPEALKMYLVFQYSPLNETIFKNVNKLPAGHLFTFENGNLKIEEYFDATFSPNNDSFETAINNIQEIVENSVVAHQIADVEVGSFLSGGVDSSFVASVARPNRTYSVGFDGEGFDETIYAKELSEILKIENKKQLISPDDFFDAIESVQYHSDEPHANLSAVPLYYLAKFAAKDLKVVLSGEGADELFAGYNEFICPKYKQYYLRLPLPIRKSIKEIALKLPEFKGKSFFINNSSTVEESYIGQAFIMDNDEANSFLSKNYKSDIKFQDVTKPYFDKVKELPDLEKKMYLDMKLWLPSDILLKADKMTMAHSLELRVPFLDRIVFGVASKISTKFLINKKTTKWAFREAAQKVIPLDWAKRKKLGFPVPFKNWILDAKYYAIVKKAFNYDFVETFFDKQKINDLLENHFTKKTLNGRKIYTIFAFIIWYKKYFIDMV